MKTRVSSDIETLGRKCEPRQPDKVDRHIVEYGATPSLTANTKTLTAW